MASHNCQGAFWVGTLKNRDLKVQKADAHLQRVTKTIWRCRVKKFFLKSAREVKKMAKKKRRKEKKRAV